MPRAAVLGQPIAHSLSPVLHNAGYVAAGLKDWTYERFEVDAAGLPGFVSQAAPDLRGFSVTMPGKFAALEFATEATERARLIGSANTLVRLDDGGWRADNTDCEGVVGSLQQLLGDAAVERAVVVGSGGTARPALWALAQRGVTHVDIINRSDRLSELRDLTDALGIEVSYVPLTDDFISLVEDATFDAGVVVSTVPSAAVAGHLEALSHAPLLDVIYDPLPTPLMTYAAANGHPAVGGHVMLAHQSYSQFEQFTGVEAPRDAMLSALLGVLEHS